MAFYYSQLKNNISKKILLYVSLRIGTQNWKRNREKGRYLHVAGYEIKGAYKVNTFITTIP